MGFDPITAALDLGSKICDRVLPDKAANDAAKAELAKMVAAGEMEQITGQITIDQTEAASKSIFVAGWRPFVGWICGCGLAYEFLLRPLLTFAVGFWRPTYGAPALDMGTLLELLLALLGMGAMRTIDKINGAGSGH